jgi:TolA-binding protein
MFISPQLDDQAATEQQTADTETQNSVLQQRIAKLRADSEHLGDLQQQIDVERAGLPADHQMDGFTDQLTAQAAETGVILASITPAAPTLVTNAAPAAPTTAASAADGSGPIDSAESVAGSADASAESVDAAAGGGSPAAPATSAGPAGQIYSIAVTVVGTGTMAANRALLSKIEKQGPRRALVTSASFAPVVVPVVTPVDGSDATVGTTETGAAVTTPPAPPVAAIQLWTMTVQLQVFVAPQSPDEKAAMASETKSNG